MIPMNNTLVSPNPNKDGKLMSNEIIYAGKQIKEKSVTLTINVGILLFILSLQFLFLIKVVNHHGILLHQYSRSQNHQYKTDNDH